MLEGLNQIDWGRLTHAFGRADDVPDSIRALGSEDAEAREKAFHELHATICHQGSRYRASAPAVPYLFELLEDPAAADRVKLIQLLVKLAVGYPEWHVPLGFDPVAQFAEADSLGKGDNLDRIRMAEPDEEQDDECERQALWQKDAYEAVLQRIGTFQKLTRDADVNVRREAVKALAWFPEVAATSLSFVQDAIEQASDAEELANAVLALGILGRYLKDRSSVPWLATQLSNGSRHPVRLNAAISLAVILEEAAPEECLAVLLEAIQDPRQTSAEGFSWHWLGPVAHASAAIMLLRPAPTELNLAALCRAAEQVYEPMAGGEVFMALLSVVIPDPSQIGKDPRTGFPRLEPRDLTVAQRQALFAIGRSPVWDAEPYYEGRLMDVGLEYGFPWNPAKFRAVLDEILRSA